MKLNKRHIWGFILCCYFVAVLVLCLAPPQQIPGLHMAFWGIPADKIIHFLMFFPYPAIAYIAFRPAEGRKWRHILVLLAVFCAGIGIAMGTEMLQSLSKYRSYELTDFYADVFGMECCAFITALFIIFKKNQ